MTDQDWEVDGAGGGPAGADSGTGDPRPDRDGADRRPANVVPFPGNWFGSVDELVPVYREPRTSVVEIAAPVAEPAESTAPVAEPFAASAADASDFWEGDADALEEVSTASDPQASIALLRSSGAPKRGVRTTAGTATADAGLADDREDRSGAARRSTKRSVWVRALAVVVLASAAGVFLLATHALTGALGSGIARRPAHSGAVSRRHTSRVETPTVTTSETVTTIVRARKDRHRAAASGVRKRTRSASQKASHTTAVSSPGAATGSTAPAVSTEGTASHTSQPPAGSNHNATAVSSHASTTASNHDSTGSGSTGTGCAAQSPDSGCLP